MRTLKPSQPLYITMGSHRDYGIFAMIYKVYYRIGCKITLLFCEHMCYRDFTLNSMFRNGDELSFNKYFIVVFYYSIVLYCISILVYSNYYHAS